MGGRARFNALLGRAGGSNTCQLKALWSTCIRPHATTNLHCTSASSSARRDAPGAAVAQQAAECDEMGAARH
eukprot:1793100-Pyramimonas_sp.AAC.1